MDGKDRDNVTLHTGVHHLVQQGRRDWFIRKLLYLHIFTNKWLFMNIIRIALPVGFRYYLMLFLKFSQKYQLKMFKNSRCQILCQDVVINLI